MKKKMFLPMDLQFFAEPTEPANPEPTEPVEPQNPKPAEPPKPEPKEPEPQEPKNKPIMIPKTRFDEVKNELDQLKQAQQQAKIDAQKKQGKFEDLYNQANQERETYKTDFNNEKERVKVLEGVMTSMLNTKLESIPEEFHDLIPGDLSPEQKLDWISKAEAKGFFKDKSQEPVGGATNPSPSSTDFENMNAFQLLKSGYGTKN